MKKLILLVLTAVIMAGCEESKGKREVYFYDGATFAVVDSCEYIIGGYSYVHKGNCRFCAERRKQEMKELVEQLKRNEYNYRTKSKGLR